MNWSAEVMNTHKMGYSALQNEVILWQLREQYNLFIDILFVRFILRYIMHGVVEVAEFLNFCKINRYLFYSNL